MTPTDQYQPERRVSYFELLLDLIRCGWISPAYAIEMAEDLLQGDKIRVAQFVGLINTPRFF